MSTANGAVTTTGTSGTSTPPEPSADTTGDEGFVSRVRNADSLSDAVDVGLDKTSELTGRSRANAPVAAFLSALFQSPSEDDSVTTRAGFQREIQMIGGAIITAFMIIVVLGMLWQLDIIGGGNGPFAELFDKYVTYGTAALSVVGIAIIIFAANLAIRAFGGMGGGGGRGGGR